MVKGIDVFRDYFTEYIDQYVLMGDAEQSIGFRNLEPVGRNSSAG